MHLLGAAGLEPQATLELTAVFLPQLLTSWDYRSEFLPIVTKFCLF